MSKYYKYTPTQNEYTTLRFTDDGESECAIKHFDTHCLVVDGDQVQLDYLIALQPIEIEFTEILFDEFFALASKSNQAEFEVDNLEKKFIADVQGIAGRVSMNEVVSWDKQEQRARTFLADTTIPSTFLQTLATARGYGETSEQLATKIVENAEAYELLYLVVLGQHQSKVKAMFDVPAVIV